MFRSYTAVKLYGAEQIEAVARCPSCDSLFHAKCVEGQATQHQQGKFPAGSGSSKWWLDHQTEAGGNEFVCPKVRGVVGCPVSGSMWICCVLSGCPDVLTSCGIFVGGRLGMSCPCVVIIFVPGKLTLGKILRACL